MGRRTRVFWLKIKALWLNLTKNRCVRLLLRLRPKITFVKKKKTWSSFRRIQNAAVSSDQFYEKLPILGSNSEWPKRLINLQIGYHEIELFLLFKLRPRLGTIQLIFKTMMNQEVTKKLINNSKILMWENDRSPPSTLMTHFIIWTQIKIIKIFMYLHISKKGLN